LAENLEKLGLDLIRFKTGTPPRVSSNTIDYDKTEIQPWDEKPQAFSYETTEYITEQIPCCLTHTSIKTHQMINDNITLSTMYSDKTEIQLGDEKTQAFYYETSEYITDQIPCWLTHTREKTHQIFNDNLTLSAMYSVIKRGTGLRYCPSIEDKIVRFHDKP